MTARRTQQDLNGKALMRSRVHPDVSGLDGTGVALCVIDYGFDLLHPAFRTATGETRFAYLLDQTGVCLERAEINRLLRQSERSGQRGCLDSLYDPHANYFGRGGVNVGAHGSWVASIAAGSRLPDFTGVAPNATLIGVQLDVPDNAWREEDVLGRPTWLDAAECGCNALRKWQSWRSYEDNQQIAAALHEAYDLACRLRPDGIVINLSIGAWAGGHDSGSTVNRAIAAIAQTNDDQDAPMAAIIAATGNAGADRGHINARITHDEPLSFTWSLEANASSQSKLEVWSDSSDGINVALSSRSNDRITITSLNTNSTGTQPIWHEGQIIGVGENRGHVRDGLYAVRMLLHPGLVPMAGPNDGAISLDVIVTSVGNTDGQVHAWIERDSSGVPQSRLVASTGSNDEAAQSARGTLTSLACAPGVISVAGLDNCRDEDAPLPMSGRGPRPWLHPSAGQAPLLAAPARGLFGARSKTDGYMRSSGTSGAAALVSGATALAMQAAAKSAQRLNRTNLLDALLGDPQAHETPHLWRPDLGYGPLCFSTPSASASVSTTRSFPRPSSVPRPEVMPNERTLSP